MGPCFKLFFINAHTLALSTKPLKKAYDEKPFGSNPKMGVTVIVKCTHCGGLVLAAKAQKTKLCPYCGTKINLLKAQKVAASNTALEASEILRKLKSEKGFTK
jgi:DNA-directed RNA polymerase subunit RPC12/RpoP